MRCANAAKDSFCYAKNCPSFKISCALLKKPISLSNEIKPTIPKSDFYFRVSRTKELEPVLNKIGFTLSELNIDHEQLNINHNL